MYKTSSIHLSMNYSKKTREELIAVCKEMRIKNYSGKKKEVLLQMIKQHTSTTSKEEAILDNKMVEKMTWNSWTSKSEHVPFKSNTPGVGDGEQKTALELNTIVLGQNSNYDMKAIIDNVEVTCDVKKLDNNTFNTGVKGRDALRPIKNSISELLNVFRKISTSSVLSVDERDLLGQLGELSPDELCVSNIQKINNMCLTLKRKQDELRSSLPKVTPFQKKGESFEIPLDKYFSICLLLEDPFPSEFEPYQDTLVFLNDISHKYISCPTLFKDSLHDLVSIFSGLQLIFVDEKMGYCICKNMNTIKFERITRGHPRFRVCG
jgi:hypothetical protein